MGRGVKEEEEIETHVYSLSNETLARVREWVTTF